MVYLLFYEKAPDFAVRQVPFRDAHREHVMAAAEGSLVLAGSMGLPDDGAAVLVFRGDSPEVAEDFARADPYVQAGVVVRWSVQSWDLVVGAGFVIKPES